MANNLFKEIPEQNEVMKTYDKNIAISASAGSGKTSVMIRKIVDLIVNKNVKLEDILVLTYTNSASSEMKQKLINKISQCDNKDVQKELDNIVNADISTFDSFCQKLVKRYFYVLDIDPSFNILQGSEETKIRNKAIKNAIKTYKNTNFDDFLMIFDFYASNRTDKNIKEIVLKMDNFCKSILNFDEFKKLSFELFEPYENPKATMLILDDIKLKLSNIYDKLNNLLKLSNKLEFDKYCVYINNILSNIEIIKNEQDFAKLIDKANELQFMRSPIKLNNDDYVLEKIKQQKQRLDNVIDVITSFVSGEEYTNSLEVCKKTTKIYFELYDEYLKEYNKLKKSKNQYDYNDIERLTLKLFENKEILQSIKDKYKHIFIDEFQDANRVQEKIINDIKGENNVFIVGDLKQAIYGFRQSNSKIFEEIIKKFDTDDKSRYLKLNCNFRTNHQILNFVNQIFSVIMTSKTASLDYKDKAMLNGEGDFLEEKGACVELDILYKEKQSNTPKNNIYSVLSRDNFASNNSQSCANFIAERITKLLEEEIYDVEEKRYRKVEYKDIAILFRSHTKQQEYIKALNNFNIPVLENSNANLDETFDASILINLIKISQNFKNDIALASVMMSNLFDFEPDEMIEIRNSQSEKCFYECVKKYNQNNNIKTKIENMQNLLDKFGQIITFDGIVSALNYILKQTNYEYKILNSFNGLSRAKNVRDFVESFANSNYNYAVTEYLNFERENVREQKVLGSITSDNVVNITTMHSSKGLEWPIVIIPELSASFFANTQEPEVMLNEDIGVGLKFYNSNTRQKSNSVFFSIVKTFNKINDISERLRLLYVAFTRPKNRLILVGNTDKLDYEKYENDWQVMESSNYLSQIINSLSQKDINKINAKVSSFNIFDDKNYVCNVINQDEYISLINNEDVNILSNKQNINDVKNLAQYIGKEYFNEKATKIAEKNSVSSLLQSQDEFSSNNTEPNKLLTSEDKYVSIQKNELGSLYHKVFELYDFSQEISMYKIGQVLDTIKKQKLFDTETINALNKNIVLKNLQILKQLCQNSQILKEQTFVMQLCYNEIEQSDIKDKVLVQGICDLIILQKDKTILVDYKFSSLNEQALKNKYHKQLFLYKKATSYSLNRPVDECYILSIKDANLIKVDVTE